MNKKQKQQLTNLCNQQAMLEAIGIRVAKLESMKFNNCQISLLGTEFLPTLKDLDAQQNINKYEWKGLPDYLPSWLIENMLYNRGSLCGYISGGVLYILPYAQAKGVDIYGLPNAVTPITYNGEATGPQKQGNPLKVISGGNVEGAQAVILYDRMPMWSSNTPPMARVMLNAEIVKYEADLLARVRNNIQNADKKQVFYVDNPTQQNQMTKDLIEAYGTEYPFVVLVKDGTNDGKANGALQSDIAIVTQALFETWQSLNSIRCMASGIANGGAFEKKERQIYGELQGDAVQTDIVLDAGLKMRRLFLQQMRAIYPEYADMLNKITVDINERSITYEEEDTDISTGGNEDVHTD